MKCSEVEALLLDEIEKAGGWTREYAIVDPPGPWLDIAELESEEQ